MTRNNDLARKVRKLAEQRQLCSYMNDTKWNELRDAMLNEMPFQPAFTVKFIFDRNEPDLSGIISDVSGDWYY